MNSNTGGDEKRGEDQCGGTANSLFNHCEFRPGVTGQVALEGGTAAIV